MNKTEPSLTLESCNGVKHSVKSVLEGDLLGTCKIVSQIHLLIRLPHLTMKMRNKSI